MPNWLNKRPRGGPWESWPVVDGSDVADVLGSEMFQKMMRIAILVSDGAPPERFGLTQDDIERCRILAMRGRPLINAGLQREPA